MKKIILLILGLSLFAFNLKEAKKILDTNNTAEIVKKITNNNLYFLEYAIKNDRLDILKLAIKKGFDFNLTDEHDNTVLDFSAFFLKKRAVKLLVPIINPNHLSIQHMNSIRFVLKGISQEYRWILYPKEKLIKIFKDDRLSKKDIKLNLKLYDYLRKNALDIIDILKQNGARFELKGAYPNEITFFIAAREGRVKSKFEYKLFEKLLGDKGKLFFYIGMNQFKKAKNFINSHTEVLKKPYFLDYPHHYFYILQKDKKYCNIVKYMINKNPNIIYYRLTTKYTPFFEKYKEKCFENLYSKYNLISINNDYERVDKINQRTNKLFEIFKYLKNKDYKDIEKFTKQPGWNFVAYKDDVLDLTGYSPVTEFHTTPFLEALLGKYKDKKALNIMLKNGGYMSGWNEIHYKILENKPLNLKKYKKWIRILKLNEGDLLKNITPVYLAVLKNNFSLVKTLVNNGASININLTDDISLIDFGIYYEANSDILKYLIKLKQHITINQIKLLALYHRFDVLKFIKKNNIFPKDMNLNDAVRKVLNKLKDIKSHLKKQDKKKMENEIIKPFQKLFNIKPDYNQILRKAVDENDTKTALNALKNGANPNEYSIYFGKSANLLMVAAYKDNKTLVNALIKHGADVLFKNKRGNTFLHIASQNDILSIALKTKAKKYINSPVDLTLFKSYPITIALFNKNYKNVKLLLENGAKLPNEYKEKIYCYMKEKNLKDLIKEFKKKGYKFKGIKCN